MTWALHGTRVAESCLQRNAWVCPEYVRTRSDILTDALVEHVGLTFAAVALGLVVALPLGVLASRSQVVETGASSIATVLYTIPSLAMFPLLLALGLPFGPSIVVVGLAIYTLGILLRNIVVGLRGVPEDTLDAATGMGLSARRRLWSVELPLALPAILAGVRIATVSTVALVTVGGLFGFGGLGNRIITGQQTRFNAEVLTATVMIVALALLLDGLLLLLERRVTPWARGEGGVSGSVVGAAAGWLTDPANWSGAGSIPVRFTEHVWISGLAVVVAAAVALPVALVLGHLGRGGALASAVANLGRAVPTLAVLVLLVLSPEPFGIRNVVTCTVVALVLFAVPPILTNAYAGIRAVDADLVEAARGMGLTGPQVLFRVELPLAVPLVVAGLRIATAQVIATATIAAIIAGPGLGRFITAGFGNQDTPQLIGGAFLVAAFAVTVEVGFQLLQRRLTPKRSSRTTLDPALDPALDPDLGALPVDARAGGPGLP